MIITISTDKYTRNIYVWCDRCQDYIVTTHTIKLDDLIEQINAHPCTPPENVEEPT